VNLFYSDRYDIPLPAGHKFPLRKYRLLREALTETGRFEFTPAPLADVSTIERIHAPEYVRDFLEGTLSPAAMRRIGFPWSDGLVLRTLASVGSTVAAASQALERGWGGALAGGTHHAFRDEGSGFCVFNDIAIAIACLRAEGRIERAAVIDLDVHQGDGTAKIFEDDDTVFTVSVHGKNNFPFRKQSSRLDIELPDGTQDEDFLAAVSHAVRSAFAFNPNVVFYQSGVDGLATDKLGRMHLTHEGLKARDAIVFSACASAGVSCVIVLGGGYSDPIESTVQAHTNTFCLAADLLPIRSTTAR
jgi:acetoin utilization deacetylase AcuC-like enzyme